MGSWFSNLLFGKDPAQTATDRQFQGRTQTRGQQADAATASYNAADASFDPDAAFKSYTTGAIGSFHTQLAKELEALKGSSVGAGRIDTGFFDQDQGKVVTDLGTNLQNQLGQASLNVAGLKESDIARRGAYAQGVNQDYNDLLAGQLDRETARENAKRQQRSALFGAVDQGVGAYFGSK